MQPGVNLEPTGVSLVQEERDRRRGQFLGTEDNQGKLCGVQGDNGGVFPSSPHGDLTWNSPSTEHGIDVGGGGLDTYIGH